MCPWSIANTHNHALTCILESTEILWYQCNKSRFWLFGEWTFKSDEQVTCVQHSVQHFPCFWACPSLVLFNSHCYIMSYFDVIFSYEMYFLSRGRLYSGIIGFLSSLLLHKIFVVFICLLMYCFFVLFLFCFFQWK